MRYYVYKTTCIPTGKYYYGVHSERRESDGYIGCGVCSDGTAISLNKKGIKSAFISSVVKYGYKNFVKDILFFFDTPEEAYAKEAEIVNQEMVDNENCLNIRLGGVGGVVPSTMTKTVLIDCLNNCKITFSSRAECQHKLGISNASKNTRMLKNRYVKDSCSEPVKLIDQDGNVFDFLDIYSCRFILGINIDKVRMMIRGERMSTSFVVNGVKTKYYICN